LCTKPEEESANPIDIYLQWNEGFGRNSGVRGLDFSATLFTTRHDGRMKPLAKPWRQIVNLVRPVDLDRLSRGVEGDLAVLATMQMLLQIGADFGSYRVVDQVVEQSQKLSAGHFSTPFFLRK
jgi:hypothetical protein